MLKRAASMLGAALAAAALAAGAGWFGFALHPEAPAVSPVNAEMEALLHSALDSRESAQPHTPESRTDQLTAADPAKQTAPPSADPASKPPASQTIELNSATIEQLQELPGIGESKARAIVELRTKLGRFRSVEQLTEVKGIGGKTLEKLKPHIRIDGS